MAAIRRSLRLVTDPASTSAPSPFAAYWRCFAGFAGGRLWLAAGLLVVTGLLEGSGLVMLLPLLHALGLGGAGSLRGWTGSVTTLIGEAGSGPVLPVVLAIFVAIKAAQAGLRAFSSMLNARLETDFVCSLRDRFYRAMVQADWLLVTRLRSSDLTQTLLAELPLVGLGTRQLLTLLSIGFIMLAQLAIALALSPAMTAVALGSGVIIGAGLRRFQHRSYRIGQAGQGKRAEMAAAVTEHLAGLKIAKSHGREAHHLEHFRRAMNAIAGHTLRLQRIGVLTNCWVELGAVVGLSVFVYLAAAAWHTNAAALLVLVFVFTRLLALVNQSQTLFHQVGLALPAFAASERLRERLLAGAESPGPAACRRIALQHGIRLEQLGFAYDPAQPAPALAEVTLALPARSVTALCGPSGAGKSTLADVVLGLLTPTRGRVLLDDAPLEGERIHHWRASIGYVPQETFLFHDTVRANLAWARPDATEAELRDALRAAAAETFVDRLPQGLDTIVGDRGVRLSGGERQRIALARALLRRPTLLVLDEATSALDAHNERLVQDAIERLQGELTILVIAHRLSTVRFADRIVVLNAGRIVEAGTWDELNARPDGEFRRLVLAGTT